MRKGFYTNGCSYTARSLFYIGQGTACTLCGPHSGPPHSHERAARAWRGRAAITLPQHGWLLVYPTVVHGVRWTSLAVTRNVARTRHANLSTFVLSHFCRAMLCIVRLLPACGARLSVTFVSCAKTTKDIFYIFSPSGSQAILFVPYQTRRRYSDGNLPYGGVECMGYEKMTIFYQYLALSQKRF